MKLIETKGTVTADGSIILQPGVLETMEVQAGDGLYLTYLAGKDVETANTYNSMMLTREGVEAIAEPFEQAEQPGITISHVILEAAQIPLDGEISIQCVPGMILISSEDPLDVVPPSLMKLFDELEIDHDTIRAVLREGEL